jgi:predicted transcriptional regulator
LLRSSAAYATAKLAFANATRSRRRRSFANAIVIAIAQRAGETDEEIADVTGYTVQMIRALLCSS